MRVSSTPEQVNLARLTKIKVDHIETAKIKLVNSKEGEKQVALEPGKEEGAPPSHGTNLSTYDELREENIRRNAAFRRPGLDGLKPAAAANNGQSRYNRKKRLARRLPS